MPGLLDFLDQILPPEEKFTCNTHGQSTVIIVNCAECETCLTFCAQCMANSSCARDAIKNQLTEHAGQCEKGQTFLDAFKW